MFAIDFCYIKIVFIVCSDLHKKMYNLPYMGVKVKKMVYIVSKSFIRLFAVRLKKLARHEGY